MGGVLKPLFKGAIATSTTKYVGVPVHGDVIGVDIGWTDATTAATITLELSSFSSVDAPVETAGAAYLWLDSGESITGPTGAAIGGALLNISNVRQRRARLKIVTTANSDFEIHDGAA